MAPALGIIADDFTGAVMVASYLETAGIACPVAFDAAALRNDEAAPVLMAGSRTRLIPVDAARAETARLIAALERAGCARVVYKGCATFDSTAEGNIGTAAELLAGRDPDHPVLLSAGFPALNCTVHQGHLFYRGRLVSDSIKRHDPLTPMADPDLVRFLSLQTRTPVVLLPHAVLVQGEAAAAAELRRLRAAGFRHVLLDASDENDVAVSAALALQAGPVVASDPLVIALAKRLAAGRPSPERPPLRHADGPAMVLAGSVGPVVLAHLAAFESRYPVLRLDLLDGRPEEAMVAEARARATPLVGPEPFAVTTAAAPDEVERAQAAFGAMGAARMAERLLAAVAAGLQARGVRRFAVAGGETSGAVVAALGVRRVRVLPENPVGTGFCIAEDGPPLSLYLKPGKLGADDILLRAVAAMG